MTTREQIFCILENNNGFLVLKNALKSGIPSSDISKMVKDGELERVAPGLYHSDYFLYDEFHKIALQYKHAVFCRSTALYLHNLSNMRIISFEANFPSRHKAKNVTGVTCYQPGDKLYKLGICEVEDPFGVKVKAYDVERCICDLFLYYHDFDPEERAFALREVDKKKLDYFKLYDYAQKLGVVREISIIMELVWQ